ncbi:complex I 24 kDa subunit family protein [Elioraea rosea]|uniref:complex I 24 kDa subunit family protein n=1 Tax=Elioraea rosea TaxID=2492390 RepID=UPI0011845BC7|nr:NAD(P)H-dependent oxidoreductase subunit E [Elioraea rosea]
MTDRASPAAAYEGGPDNFAFSEATRKLAEKQIAKYPEGKQASAVKGLLDLAMRQMEDETGSRWLPRAAMDHVAGILGMAPIRVYEVASFYTMFKTRPVGRHHLQVCTTTPCWLRGSDAVLAACRRAAGNVPDGTVSEDGEFSVEEVECLGACVNAPVLWVGDYFYEDLDGQATERILEALKRGEHPAPGSAKGRQTSAPEGGPTTLKEVPPHQPYRPDPPAPEPAAPQADAGE